MMFGIIVFPISLLFLGFYRGKQSGQKDQQERREPQKEIETQERREPQDIIEEKEIEIEKKENPKT